jgi:small-conductance mechanosensitive channel
MKIKNIMERISDNSDVTTVVVGATIFIMAFLLLLAIARVLYKRVKRYVHNTPGKIDDFVLELFRLPLLWLLFWVLFKIFSVATLNRFAFSTYIAQANNILLIWSVAYILTKFVKAGAYYLQNKLDITQTDNLLARKNLTQLKVFQGIANTLIVVVAISISLLTFDKAKAIGVSLLTSAGIVGIVVGFAAQKSLGLILAGIQIAITQPIRLDDVVIVEGEWGRIEEITLTYVVVKIWDERRLILPVTYFLETPFQNWTRSSSNIIGTIFLHVDYNFPVNSVRDILPTMLAGNLHWDKRVCNVQVTNTTDRSKEIRILLSSSDSSKNWDLRTAIREKLIDFINDNYPDTFVRIRITEIPGKDKDQKVFQND